MDLAALMNDGAEDEGSKKKSPEIQRSSQPSIGQTGYASSQGQAQSPMAQTPLYPPTSLVGQRTSGWGSQGLTPLHTPGKGAPGGQYPFPPSAGGGPPFSATTPGARPPSYPYPHQASPLQQHMPGPSSISHAPYPHHPQAPSSASPTPSSHHSQHTPHSVRQSPQFTMSQGPTHPPPGQPFPQYQLSQPSTPLGPPPLHYQRSAGNMAELTSPYHQRTFSGASNGVLSNSPAIGNLVESPNAFQRPSPIHHRRTSEYLSQVGPERERSLSVSPKTMPAPRPPSLGSRHSSGAQGLSSRSSTQHTIPESPLAHANVPQQYHVTHPPASAQPLPNLNTASEVTRPTPPPSLQQPPPAIAHSQHPAPAPVAMSSAITEQPAQTAAPLKRHASAEETQEQPPLKRPKITKRHTKRPPWAILSKHNPRYNQQEGGVQQQPPPQTNGHPKPTQQPSSQLPNGHTSNMNTDNKPPWQQNPPLDFDLIRTSAVMGKWEKTFRWNTPYPDLLMVVQNWLSRQLEELRDVGMDAREGTVEIEARMGVLHDTRTGLRFDNYSMNANVIHPSHNEHLRFESNMSKDYHEHMNKYLNAAIQSSIQPGRVPMAYKHLYETDSFHALSPVGLAMLPEAIKRRRRNHNLRLRVTRDSKSGRVLGRIVKMPIENLHIYNPAYPYDCRISINLEVNLDRPDIDPETLIVDSEHNEPDRKKDRLSYKHLSFSIDLTKVESTGKHPTFELECEVDSAALRQQIQRAKEGRENAFGDVVGGFLDDVTFLMREAPPGKGAVEG